MNISLDKLEELAEKATPGPWNPFNGHQTFAVEKVVAGNKTTVVTWNGFDGNGLSNRQNKRNANFIAAANPDTIKSLIARVRAAESQLKAAQEPSAENGLLPCPFCGGENCDESAIRGYKAGNRSQPIIAAGCMDCGAAGPDVPVPDHSTGYAEASELWNLRALAAPVPADHIPDDGEKVDTAPEVAVPDENAWIIEKLSYHKFEREDLSINDCLKYLESEWTEVSGRTVRQLVMQILYLLAGQISPRITEQDAREIAVSFFQFTYTITKWPGADQVNHWVATNGRALLDKLNAGRVDHIAEAGKMMRIGLDQPWSMRSCVKKLIYAAGILLDHKNYDGHGHEQIRAAQVAAQKYIDHSVDANKMNTNTINRRALEWMLSGDTGLSSEAICAHMLGLETEYARYPSDPADLGRCLRLLELIPEWKPRIKEMANFGPGWAGQIEVWDELNNTMANEVGIDWSKGKKAPKTYKAMKLAQASGYRNDPAYECGFDKNGFISWSTRNREEEEQ